MIYQPTRVGYLKHSHKIALALQADMYVFSSVSHGYIIYGFVLGGEIHGKESWHVLFHSCDLQIIAFTTPTTSSAITVHVNCYSTYRSAQKWSTCII